MKKYAFMLLIQFFAVFFLSLIAYLLRPLNVVHGLLVYGLVPIVSFLRAFRLGLGRINPYLAWIGPPIAMTLAGFLSTMGIGPSPLPVMIAAMLALVGAAAGDVTVKSQKKGKK